MASNHPLGEPAFGPMDDSPILYPISYQPTQGIVTPVRGYPTVGMPISHTGVPAGPFDSYPNVHPQPFPAVMHQGHFSQLPGPNANFAGEQYWSNVERYAGERRRELQEHAYRAAGFSPSTSREAYDPEDLATLAFYEQMWTTQREQRPMFGIPEVFGHSPFRRENRAQTFSVPVNQSSNIRSLEEGRVRSPNSSCHTIL